MKKLLFICCYFAISTVLQAQSYYTIIQGGANIGFANEGYKGAFNGYSAHFIFGKNYNDKAYLGLGLGNERLKGSYSSNDPHDEKYGEERAYDQNLFPIFLDGRLPIGEFNKQSKLGLIANAGYAPRLSAQYDNGVLFKGGFFYLYETAGKMDWNISAAYGYQQLRKNVLHTGKDFQHQQFNLTVGIMLK